MTDGRAKALACAPLADREWWTVRALAEFASEHLGAFQGLDHPATCKAVRRALRKLADVGIVEIRKEMGVRGLNVMYARRPFTPAEIEAEHEQLMREVAEEQGAYITDL